MQSNQPQFHGSDLETIAAYYHISQNDIINYSSNVNPLGLSDAFQTSVAQHITCVCSYPDRNYTELKQSISSYSHTVPEHLLIGSGATELISLLIQGIHPKKALLVQPTYSEYEREIRLHHGEIYSFYLSQEDDFRPNPSALIRALTDDYDLLILCNPNNPTGTLWTQDQLRSILAHCQRYNIMVLIDETYIEFTESIDKVNAIELTDEFVNLFVIRGVSKFFSAPGLRLGYGVTSNEELLTYICQSLNPWNVHSIAAVCGSALFEDQTFIKQTQTFIANERRRVLHLLKEIHRLHVYPMSSNFVLLRILDPSISSEDTFEMAIHRNMMLRNCSSFPGLSHNHIRFCLQMPEHNDLLIQFFRDTFS